MASEMIRSILETEEDCKAKETEARKKAEARKQQAKEDAAEIISKANTYSSLLAFMVRNSSSERAFMRIVSLSTRM